MRSMDELSPGVVRARDPGGREAIALQAGDQRVLVALLGAQILSWQGPHGEVLWWGSKVEYAAGKPVRGGIPLVFPWFGDHPTDKQLPAHGFVRNLTWRVAHTAPHEVTLACSDDAKTLVMWPHAFALTLTVALGHTLRIALAIHNPGAALLRCEEALHTYFAVGDIHTAEVRGLEGIACTETAVAPEGAWDTTRPLRFRAETDRVFQGTPDRLELHTPALRRHVRLTTANANSAIVWNPWPAKTARLSGMAADDWQRFCCVETANVRQHALAIAPGQRHTLTLELDCRAN